jgi:hypothetical protein
VERDTDTDMDMDLNMDLDMVMVKDLDPEHGNVYSYFDSPASD